MSLFLPPSPSLSFPPSLDCAIVELKVLGVKVGVKKRPYDMAARLMIDEICVVDRMHHYGPEYELLVCSSGGHLVLPEPDSKPEETVSIIYRKF